MANYHPNNNNNFKMDKYLKKTFSVGFNFMDIFYNVFKQTLQFTESSALNGTTIFFNKKVSL